MRVWLTVGLVLFLAADSGSQLSIVSVQRLPLDSLHKWSAPQFAPDGKTIYYTSDTYDGIWAYSVEAKTVRQITDDQSSGYGFTLSSDGERIAYRKTSYGSGPQERVQEVIVTDLQSAARQRLGSGSDVTTPVFLGDKVHFSAGATAMEIPPDLAPDVVVVLGIDNTKIQLLRNGKRDLLDPFGDGSYIWPVLSPDKRLLAAYDMSRGTFICDLQGNVVANLGRRDSPSWTKDGHWLVYMDDKDDGHRILSSDLYCISLDGRQVERLTNTSDVTEMFPQCSPTENKIVCGSLEGGIYVLEYREGGR